MVVVPVTLRARFQLRDDYFETIGRDRFEQTVCRSIRDYVDFDSFSTTYDFDYSPDVRPDGMTASDFHGNVVVFTCKYEGGDLTGGTPRIRDKVSGILEQRLGNDLVGFRLYVADGDGNETSFGW